MVSFENFKPRLKIGQTIPEGQKVIFETKMPFKQIILPIEAIDLLALCDGTLSVREIIEKIYRKNGSVHFKALYNSILHLRDKDFFLNSSELNVPNSDFKKSNDTRSLFFDSLFDIFLMKRIYNDRVYPLLFYIFSMSALVIAILGFQNFDLNIFNENFLLIDGSYLKGLVFLFASCSILITVKNIYKLLLQIFLTGRAYNFSISFHWFGVFFKVGAESMHLVSNKLYLFIFHLSCVLSYFCFSFVMVKFFPETGYSSQFLILATILTFVDLDPFRQSELSQFVSELYEDEALLKLSAIFKNKSLLNISKIGGVPKNNEIFRAFSIAALIWSGLALYFMFYLSFVNIPSLIQSLSSSPFVEIVASLFFATILGVLSILLAFNFSQTLVINVFAPLFRKIMKFYTKSKMQYLNNYNLNNLLVVLEKLPLFSHFNHEILNLILSKSQIQKYPVGTSIVVQGEKSDSVFVLLDGQVTVQRKASNGQIHFISNIHPTSIFGENAIIEDSPRSAEVIASKTSTVLCVPAPLLRQLAQGTQYIREIESFKNVIMVNQFFSSAPMFRELPIDLIHLFLTRGKIESYKANRVVIRQGSRGDGFYLIIRGTVGVFINNKIVNKIKQGGFFGEISLIADVPRTATITTLESTVLLKINADTFWEILSQNIDVAMFIESVGKMRVKEDIDVLKSSKSKEQQPKTS